jgi:hypothetical protein
VKTPSTRTHRSRIERAGTIVGGDAIVAPLSKKHQQAKCDVAVVIGGQDAQ